MYIIHIYIFMYLTWYITPLGNSPSTQPPFFSVARGKQPECKTRIHWLRGSRELIRGTALSVRSLSGCMVKGWVVHDFF